MLRSANVCRATSTVFKTFRFLFFFLPCGLGCVIHYRSLPPPAAVMDVLAGVSLHEDHVCPGLESFLSALTSDGPEIDARDVPCDCARAACEHCGALVARCSLNDHAQVGGHAECLSFFSFTVCHRFFTVIVLNFCAIPICTLFTGVCVAAAPLSKFWPALHMGGAAVDA